MQAISVPYPKGISKLALLDLMGRTRKWGEKCDAEKLDASTYSTNGQKDLFLGLEFHVDGSVTRPKGTHYTRRAELIREMNNEISGDAFIHELVCIVEHGCNKISGLKLTLTRQEDDNWDEDLACRVSRKLVRGNKFWDLGELYYNPAKESLGSVEFDINLPEDLWEDKGKKDKDKEDEDEDEDMDEKEEEDANPCTARLNFCDSHDKSIVYGALYIRLVPTPSATRLLPVGSLFEDASFRKGKELMMLKSDPQAPAPAFSPSGPLAEESSQSVNVILDRHATLTGWRLESAKGSSPFDPWKDHEAALQGVNVKRDVSIVDSST